jgi:hypothetical protein
MIGCGTETRYDATVSIRAGFQGHELARLWPDTHAWQIREFPAGWFSHLFLAYHCLA